MKTLSDTVILRKVADNLRRLYKLTQPNRTLIVRQALTLLQDNLPMSVLKIDIKGFYESVPVERLLARISDEHLLAPQSLRMLKATLANCGTQLEGLPRGLSISAPLAELYMRDFDREVRRLDGVYYYARYVDDILIFTYHRDAAGLLDAVCGRLPPGLRTNLDKTGIVMEVEAAAAMSRPLAFDYLGYRFGRDSQAVSAAVTVRIAAAKVRKIKTRIVRAFLSHMFHPDYGILLHRIRFLTGNYEVDWMGAKRGLKAGIYYSYPLLTDLTQLDELTGFLCANAFARNNAFGARLSALSIAERRRLARHSFRHGFTNRLTHHFTLPQLNRIMRCWIDVP